MEIPGITHTIRGQRGLIRGIHEASWRYHADPRERDRAVLHRGEQEKIGGIRNGAMLRDM